MPHFLVLPHPLSLKSCLKSYKVPYKHHKYNLTHTPGYHQSSTCLQDFMDIKKSSLPFIPWLPLIPTLKLACQCCHQVGVGGTWFPTTADKAYHLRHVKCDEYLQGPVGVVFQTVLPLSTLMLTTFQAALKNGLTQSVMPGHTVHPDRLVLVSHNGGHWAQYKVIGLVFHEGDSMKFS